ncbi:glycerophosphodiester phosphodiesterase [Ramlibacter sp. XY19]|uniref:glycerophosphodiester phosphodiesterase n=1 Tax=Ramlibacter paludis TaxID=2908000 RepID=UPI0023DB14DD|nr:glycerophosphodiester phosphodiesterase [Ramlibacter paludis]MCG2591476.1 glycerophosphodiester phosphodiesterase [Ramlibacter paludis]
MQIRSLFIALALPLLAAACGGGAGDPIFKTLQGSPPLVIGHRGAAGERPEHTLESYRRAIELGADFVEPDLVLTKDGVMVARHEPVLDATTDVATKFPASRRSTKNLDGVATTAYFASDFTLAELKTLRAVQATAGRSKEFDGLYPIPTLDEVIAFVKSEGASRGRTVGIYPEIKHSTFHAGIFGANVFEDKLVATLHAAYGNAMDAPVFIQSFEVANLQYLNTKTNIRLVQLVDADDVNDDGSMSLVAPYRQPYDFVVSGDARTFADLLTGTGLDFVKTYADAVGPWKPYLVKTVNDGIDRTGDGKLTINDRRVDGSTGVIEAAHARGLLVHTWTFRNDASGYGFQDPQAEMEYYMRLGVDGLFTDFPGTGVAARNAILR